MNGSRAARLGGRTGRRSALEQIEVLLYLVENGPGRSELEVSEAIYGIPGYPQRLQQTFSSSSALARSNAKAKGAPPIRNTYHPIRLRRQVSSDGPLQ